MTESACTESGLRPVHSARGGDTVCRMAPSSPVPPQRLPSPRTAFWNEHQCQLVSYHAPQPVMTEFHHSRPVFLQNRLYGVIKYGPDLWLCSNCHDAVHAWLYFLLGERRMPTAVGRAAKAEAQRTFDWFLAEADRVGLPVIDSRTLHRGGVAGGGR